LRKDKKLLCNQGANRVGTLVIFIGSTKAVTEEPSNGVAATFFNWLTKYISLVQCDLLDRLSRTILRQELLVRRQL
jgi:hypothetical protein